MTHSRAPHNNLNPREHTPTLSSSVEYKYIIRVPEDGKVLEWQPTPANLVLSIPEAGPVAVTDDWEGAAHEVVVGAAAVAPAAAAPAAEDVIPEAPEVAAEVAAAPEPEPAVAALAAEPAAEAAPAPAPAAEEVVLAAEAAPVAAVAAPAVAEAAPAPAAEEAPAAPVFKVGDVAFIGSLLGRGAPGAQ
jgi:hypothetical protein